MKKFAVVLCSLFVAGFFATTVYADEPTEAEKAADWKTLAPLAQKFSWYFTSEGKFTSEAEKYMPEFNAWKKEFVPFFEEFKAKYGSTQEEVEKHFQDMKRPMGCRQDIGVSFRLAIQINVPEHEKQMAGWAEKFATKQYNMWQYQKDNGPDNIEVLMKRADRSLRFMKLAQQLNPDGNLEDQIKTASEAVKETLAQYKEHLKKVTWPENNPNFNGKDEPYTLAKEAIEFLKQHPDWTAPEFDDKHTPVAAVVSGNGWEVYKKAPLTEEPLQYSLKMLVAFVGDDPDIAYCYFMEFYTAEVKGVQPALPFRFANSRQYESYRMLRENLPKGE